MNTRLSYGRRGSTPIGSASVAGAVLAGILAAPAGAFDVQMEGADLRIDTTLSQGFSWRLEDPASDIVGTANGGKAFSVNNDDGTLNFKRGDLVANVSRFTTDIDFESGPFGAFVRLYGFYDWELDRGDRARTALTPAALETAGSELTVRDSYVTFQSDVANSPSQLRFGQQVLSWGESTFIPGGINIINPVDVTQLRSPGSELRNALLPVNMLSGSISPTSSITFEGFYQTSWKKVTTDPPGTYFSTNDFVGAGGTNAFLGFGDFSDQGTNVAGLVGGLGPLTAINGLIPLLGGTSTLPVFDETFLSVPRAPDNNPDDGDWGLAFRYFAEQLGGTEFGLYYVNYSSRLPVISARTGSAADVANGLAAAQATVATLAPSIGLDAAGQIGGAIGVSQYAKGARYIIEYPENIDMIGVSFNTDVGTTGWALQGEYSWKHDAPLQVDDVELLFAGLTPLALAAPGAGFDTFRDNQVGSFLADTYIPGFIQRDVSQLQATATNVIGPVLGADSGVFVIEAGAVYVHDMPATSELRLNTAGTNTSGNPRQAMAMNPAAGGARGAHVGKPPEDSGDFATEWSAGLRLATSFTYNNALGPVNLIPRLQYAWDFYGNSPQPAGPFLEGRMSVNVGLRATYLQSWEADLGYTTFFGAEKQNLLHDRDFINFVIKYSF